ncbi:2OG-Fe(II) oxygenase [Bordetella sputigena]|uniref:putative 2OG-Fe(II) oxygenase n=1 Tax=Bordetella sputigena TaxID=1416810 RepID=UPI0039EDE97F
MSDSAIQWLWATPVSHVNLLDSGVVDPSVHQALQDFAAEHEDELANDERRSATATTKYTRYDTQVFERTRNDNLDAIRSIILSQCDAYAAEVYGEAMREYEQRVTMWFVVQRNGHAKDAVHAHYHEGSDLAFVYYLTTPKDGSGQIALMDPRGPIGRGGFAVPRHSLIKFIEPQEGDMIIFPRYLMHYTTPNTDTRTRRVIAGSVAYEAKPRSQA